VPKSSGRADPNSKWVAGRGDVLQMKISATLDEALHGLRVEFTEPGGIGFDRSKEIPVTNQRDLDGFRVTRAFVPFGSEFSSSKSLIDGKWRCKGADEILFANALMPFLTPTPESAWLSVVVGMRT